MIRDFFVDYLLSNLLPFRPKNPKLPKVRVRDVLLVRETLPELEKLLTLDELLELALPGVSSKSLDLEELISTLLELDELSKVLELPELLELLMLAELLDAPLPIPNPVLVELLLLPKPIPPRFIPAYAVLVRKTKQALKTKIDLFIPITSNSVNRLCLLLKVTLRKRI